MANYNSGRLYNKKLDSGGANYNSGPFTIVILDNGYGIDTIQNIMASVSIDENASGDDSIVLVASVEVIDQSISSNDNITVQANLNINDNGIGQDSIPSILSNLSIFESAIGLDTIAIAGAFFVIDSNNILQPLGVLVTRDSRYELLPATRDITDEIPGMHGEYDFGTELGPRLIELHVATDEGNSPLQKAHLQRLFAKYLDPTKGTKSLIFSDDIEKTYIVKYSGKIDITQYPTWFEFVLPFKMSDPLIKGSFEKILVGSGTLINEGTFETSITVEIAGPITNPSLTIGGETLSYTGTISSGQSLIIDSKTQTAKIGQNNALGNYNKVFPFIQPGNTPVTSTNNVTIKWRDKWI